MGLARTFKVVVIQVGCWAIHEILQRRAIWGAGPQMGEDKTAIAPFFFLEKKEEEEEEEKKGLCLETNDRDRGEEFRRSKFWQADGVQEARERADRVWASWRPDPSRGPQQACTCHLFFLFSEQSDYLSLSFLPAPPSLHATSLPALYRRSASWI